MNKDQRLMQMAAMAGANHALNFMLRNPRADSSDALRDLSSNWDTISNKIDSEE